MSCDFTRYNSLSNTEREKSVAAQAACAATKTAEDALTDARATFDKAVDDQKVAYDEWEAAKQAMNAEAANLGIEPCPPQEPGGMRR